MEYIAVGVPVFKGVRRSVPNFPDAYHLYAVCGGNKNAGNECAVPFNNAFEACTYRLQDSDEAQHPWETLEQPSMSFCYGFRPGTITLNHWASSLSKPNPPLELAQPDMKPREVKLATILERLIYLEGGFEEDYEDLMYKNLYGKFLRDPDKHRNPHKGMELQIADLIIVLSRREWIDFSVPGNQIVAKFFTNADYTENGRYKTFFHQLLLSLELHYRIHSKSHAEGPKQKLLSQLPPCIAWDLALARKWREGMSIEKFNIESDPEQIRFHLRVKNAQVKALRKFARKMKWPNLVKVDNVLKERDPGAKALEERSSDCMSYFTGVILPGGTLPWLIMNSLVDCDDDVGSNCLAALTHIHPNSGFQYKGTTYWSSTSIVGKVLAPECHEIAGWIGPARPAPDLARIQVARIRQRRPKPSLRTSDVESMMERSDPLGPPSSHYPIAEYELLRPETDDYLNNVRVEKLALKPTTSSANVSPDILAKPLTYDAAVQFAIDGRSWPLRLSYDVSFISACPCSGGPHLLFFDYVYKAVKVEDILTIKHWGEPDANTSIRATSSTRGGGKNDEEEPEAPEDASEKVLAIEAFGVSDNEVLARAWCSHWGLSAIVADVQKICMACAIREAYAACVNVAILVDGSRNSEDDL